MRDNNIKINFPNIIFYILGFLLVGLGVNIMYASTIGLGAWDTVTFNITKFLIDIVGITKVNILFLHQDLAPGHISMIISLTILTMVLLYRRKITLLFMLIPVFAVGSFVNLWYFLFNGYEATGLILQSSLFILGLITIPFGLALVVKSTFPAFVFEEWTFMMADIFKTKNFARVRLGIEILGITIGIIFGALTFWSEGNLGSVNVGSVIAAFAFGPILAYELKIVGVTESVTSVREDLANLWQNIKEMFYLVKNEIKLKRVIKYFIGMLMIAFGVVMMIRSSIGNSSWDTLHYALHKYTGITVGEATIVVALIFTLLVILLNKNIKYLLMAIPIFTVGYFIDVFNLQILADFEVTTLLPQILTYTVGLFLLPMGGALLIVSTYPAGVFDEFMLAVMRKLKSEKMVLIRVIMELSAVIVAFIIGRLADIGFGKIGIGTLIFSLAVGWLVKRYLNLYERIGLVENKQID